MSREKLGPLAYSNGDYTPERFRRLGAVNSPRATRFITRILKLVHGPWFAVRMPEGVAELTTIGRRSGQPRSTFVRAYRVGSQAYFVSIAGEQGLPTRARVRELHRAWLHGGTLFVLDAEERS